MHLIHIFPPVACESINFFCIWAPVSGVTPRSLGVLVVHKPIYGMGAPTVAKHQKHIRFYPPFIVVLNMAQVICLLILSMRDPLWLNLNGIASCYGEYSKGISRILTTVWLSENQRILSFLSFGKRDSRTMHTALNSLQVELLALSSTHQVP